MNRIRSYFLFLFFTSIIFSCHHGQEDFNNIDWKNAGNDNGISFSISEEGKGEKGKLDIQFVGWLINNKLVQDTLEDASPELDSVFIRMIMEDDSLLQLQKKSKGYIKVNIEEYFRHIFSTLRHYTLYYPGISTIKDLIKDSLGLVEMNLFNKIEITTQDEAVKAYSEYDPDTVWRHFLETNPLPSSIDLTLKKELYLNNKFDSVKNILSERFPVANLSIHYDKGFPEIKYGKKKIRVYRFTVL